MNNLLSMLSVYGKSGGRTMTKEDLCRLIELLCAIDGTYYLQEDKSDVIAKAVDIATEVLENEYGKW
jgi:hypothetical protein